MKRIIIKMHGCEFPCALVQQTYIASGRPVFELIDLSDGGNFATISTELGIEHGADCFWLKNWSENEAVAAQFLAEGYVELTGRTTPTGFVECPEVRITEKMKAAILTEAEFYEDM